MGGCCCLVEGTFFGMVLFDFRRMCVSQMTVLVMQICAHPHEDMGCSFISIYYIMYVSCLFTHI